MFLCLFETRSLKFVTFVGNLDTDCFGSVAEACNKKYGDQYIVKKRRVCWPCTEKAWYSSEKIEDFNEGQKLHDGKQLFGMHGRLTK